MRAAVLFGLGSCEKEFKQFQKDSDVTWLMGMPVSSTDADAILIFGGDGTVHRHLPELARLQIPVLVVPCGSGNDFARALNLRKIKDSREAWRSFTSGAANVRRIDLGLITSPDTSAEAGEALASHFFCCVAGVGLDVEVAKRANRLPRWLRARGGYVISLAPVLFRFAPLRINILAQQLSGEWSERSSGPTLVAAFANTPTYGGGIRIAPQARVDDGQLETCVITEVDDFKRFCLFPTVYFGRHLRVPEVNYFRSECVRLESETPLEVYADGEYVCHTPIEVAVQRDALPVIVSQGSAVLNYIGHHG
jgi:diacylglycerol kinase (ATP)